MSDYTVREVDLGTAHQLGGSTGLFTVENPPGRRVLVPDVPDTAFIRIGEGPEDGDAIPLLGGFQDCIEGDERVYIQNPAGTGTLRVVFTDDPDLEPGDVAVPSPTGFSSTRLSDDLNAGFSYNAGDDASEDVDTKGAAKAVVRGKVSGISGFSDDQDATYDEVNPVAVAQEEGLLFFIDAPSNFTENLTLVVMDLADADSPVELGTQSPAGFAFTSSAGLAYDAENDLVVGLGCTGDGAAIEVLVWDVSDPTAPAFNGSTSLGFSENGFDFPGFVGWDSEIPTRMIVAAAQGSAGSDTVRTAVVDHTGGGAPTIVADRNDELAGGIEPGGFWWSVQWSNRNLQRRAWSASGYGAIQAINSAQTWRRGAAIYLRPDADLGVVFASDFDNVLKAVDTETASILYEAHDDWRAHWAFPELNVLVFSGTSDTYWYAYTRQGADLIRQEAPDGFLDLAVLESEEVYYTGEDTVLRWYTVDSGSDRLVVQALDPAGNPVETVGEESAVLRDSVEARVELALNGEDQVRVSHLARSDTGGQREHFDVYREAV